MKKLIVLVSGMALMASCSSTKIMTDSINDIDLDNRQTVRIEYQTMDGAEQINPINVQRVEGAIQNETQARGLSLAEDADLTIVWGVGIDLQRNYSSNSTYHNSGGYGYRGRHGGYSTGSGHSHTTEYTTKNGTFQIALIDSQTDQVLWIVTASDSIKGKSKKAEEKINEIMAKVFEEFPVEKQMS